MPLSRRTFLKLASIPLLSEGQHATASKRSAPRMPTLFIGHGSPMNAIQDNDFTRSLTGLGNSLPRPRAIVALSAHWQTPGKTLIDVQPWPLTIHDFQGFPSDLSKLEYPAHGSPELAAHVPETLSHARLARTDSSWGIDHGTWTVLRHLYPKADIPVFQVSIDYSTPAAIHYAIGQDLAYLREQGVLILGSGGIVHNLHELDSVSDSRAATRSWAQSFDDRVADALRRREDQALMQYETLHPHARLAVPTPDHYWPLLYVLGAAKAGEPVTFPFEGFQLGTLSMRCVQFG